MVNNFDVLKQMCADNREIMLGTEVIRAQKVKAGTEITIGIGGDFVGAMLAGDLQGVLLLFNRKQFDEIKATMEAEVSA